MLCESSRSRLAADDLATLYGDPPLTGYSVQGVHVRSSNGRTTGDVTLVLEWQGGLEDRTVVPLVEEVEAWRPCP